MKQPKKTVITKSDFSFIDFLKSSKFGVFLLICSTTMEGFYAFKLFKLTGEDMFDNLLFTISLIYAFIVAGVIVFFALRNNIMMVWAAVIFELIMNLLLDIQAVWLPQGENYLWIFISMLAIGSILPVATKAFADEINKKILTRNPPTIRKK